MVKRVDLLLVEQGLAASRTQAQRWIEQGKVEYCEGGRWSAVKKPGLKLEEDCELKVTQDESDRFVSRGGLKLAAALEQVGLSVEGLSCLDVGQSTGGFTDCLLQSGAAQVVGIDVGHGQLADRLREDPRVTCLEGINARDLPVEQLLELSGGKGFDLVVMDVSFISQSKILPGLVPVMAAEGQLITLIKPQFEVGKEHIGKGGIVRDSAQYQVVRERIEQECRDLGFTIKTFMDSPIRGGDGNREFLLHVVASAV